MFGSNFTSFNIETKKIFRFELLKCKFFDFKFVRFDCFYEKFLRKEHFAQKRTLRAKLFLAQFFFALTVQPV